MKIFSKLGKKIIYLISIITFIASPLSAMADGGVIKPLPEGDWVWVDENSQQAFINYEQGTEKLILAVDIKEENSDIAWIVPVPSKPEEVEIDITSDLPLFFGDNIMSKAKLEFSETLEASYYTGFLGQVWTLPFGAILLVSMGGAGEGRGGDMATGDLVSVESRIEKAGMIAEVITAKDGQAIYDYFSQRGFDIKQGSISELNSYIEKDYSFVVSWIASGMVSEESRGQRGIFISFPTPKIYYPLVLTSAYGDTEIPITIRVLDHVKPTIFSEIRPYTKVSYFTERTKGYGRGREARCISDMSQFRTTLELYYEDHGGYPTSLKELENDKEWGDGARALLKDTNDNCNSYPSYYSKNENDYTMTLTLWRGVYLIDSSLFAGFADEKESSEEELVSPELERFYGNKKPWKGEADYTKITINAPAKLLKQDLWMKEGRPLKISLALWTVNNSLVVFAFLYLFIVGITSFIAGGLAGLLCFRKFKKYACIGLANVATLLSLFLVYRWINKKRGEDIKRSSLGFVSLFSITFISLLSIFPITTAFWEGQTDIWLVALIFAGWTITSAAILLLVTFVLNKLGIKNRVVRTILTIVLFFALWIGINLFLFMIIL